MSELFFDESVILLDVEADSKEGVLEVIGQNLVDKGLVKESFIPAILNREKEYATGLPTAGVSVAIPHTDAVHVIQKTISVAVLKEPVDFGVMGDAHETTPVQLIFMLAMDETHAQLFLLQKLMQVFQDEEVLTFLVNQKNRTDIKKLLTEKLDLTLIEKGGK